MERAFYQFLKRYITRDLDLVLHESLDLGKSEKGGKLVWDLDTGGFDLRNTAGLCNTELLDEGGLDGG